MADGKLIFDTAIDTTGFQKGVKGVAGIAQNAFGLVTKTIVGVTAATSAFALTAGKVGAEFSAQMSRVQAISGATADELNKLNKQAIDLGASTAFSASEAAAGMENLASAGFEVTEIMAAMPGLLDLAAVSGGDVAAAAEIAGSAIRSFGLEAQEAGHVANVFARAAADTNAEALDMGEALKYVGPIAKAMGHSLEETAAAIGIMSDAGIKGSMAGTALRGSLSRLAKPTKTMQDTMEGLGLSFYDAQGNMLPLAGIIEELERKTAGLTQEQKNQALVTLFGQESLSGMLALIDAGPEKLDALTQSLINSDGAAEEMATTIQDNFKGALEEMMGALETLQITLFQTFEDDLKGAAFAGAGYLNQITAAFNATRQSADAIHETENGLLLMSEGTRSASDAWKDFGGVVGNIVAEVISKLAELLPKVLEVGVSVVDSLLDGIESNIGTISESASTIITSLIQSTITFYPRMIRLGLDLLTRIAEGLAKNAPALAEELVKAVKLLADSVSKNIQPFVAAGASIIGAIVDAVGQSIPILVSAGLDIITALVDAIIQNLPSLIDSGYAILMGLVDAILTALPVLVEAGMTILVGLIDGIIQALPLLFDASLVLLNGLISAITENLPIVLEAAVTILNALIEGIVTNLPIMVDGIIQLLTALVTMITENLPLLVAGAILILNAIVTGIVDNLPMILEATLQLLDVIVAAVIDNLPLIIDAAIEIILAIMDAMLDNLDLIIDATFTLIEAIISAILNNLPKIVQMGITLVLRLIDGIISRLPQIAVTAVSLITRLLQTIAGKLPELLAMGIKLIGELVIGIVRAIPRVLSTLGSLAVSALAALGRGFLGAFQIGRDLITGLWNGISSVYDWIMGKISGFVGSIVGGIKSFFGIKSPSRVMADEIGKMLPPGIAIGFEAQMPNLKKQVDDQLENLTDKMKQTVDLETGLIGNIISSDSSSSNAHRYDADEAERGGMIHTEINVDGKPTGDAITPYVSGNLAKQRARRLAYDY